VVAALAECIDELAELQHPPTPPSKGE
jgi:hypothetical protein